MEVTCCGRTWIQPAAVILNFGSDGILHGDRGNRLTRSICIYTFDWPKHEMKKCSKFEGNF